MSWIDKHAADIAMVMLVLLTLAMVAVAFGAAALMFAAVFS